MPDRGYLFVIRHSSFVIRHSSFVIRHSSFVIRHSSFDRRHPSVEHVDDFAEVFGLGAFENDGDLGH
jgi:hypothetical protein